MYMKIKRLIDIILSLIGLIVLSPIFLILIIAIKLDSKVQYYLNKNVLELINLILIF